VSIAVARLANTRRLFLGLLGDLDIDLVCDVGSMDGRDALAFRARLPRATVLALEPNPANFARMQADPQLGHAAIHLVPAAASNRPGRRHLHLVDPDVADPMQARQRRGMGSLHQREGRIPSTARVEVDTLTLDDLLLDGGARIGVWIDAEGHAFEVIEGMRRAASRVQLIHVELESEPCIAPGRPLAAEVDGLLRELGFDALATDQPHTHPQFNAVYLRRNQPARLSRRVVWQLWRACWRRRLMVALRHTCPGCLRRLVDWQLRFAR
jgi:FkbM family methyltransferase